jgi:hypothetical protein
MRVLQDDDVFHCSIPYDRKKVFPTADFPKINPRFYSAKKLDGTNQNLFPSENT